MSGKGSNNKGGHYGGGGQQHHNKQHRGGGGHNTGGGRSKHSNAPSDRQVVEGVLHLDLNPDASQHQHQQQQQQQQPQQHPLENEWTFWYDRRPTAKRVNLGERDQYESNLRPVGQFTSIEEFWKYYNHMIKPSKLETNANYHLFKKSIKPLWEDTANVHGGRWLINLKPEKVSLLDECWESLILAMIGETLDFGDEICGAVISRRKMGDKIALWTKNRDDDQTVLAIGRKIKQTLRLNDIQISYQFHEESIKAGVSYTNTDKHTL